jgi:NAD-dependent DNA ligase
MSDEAFYNRVGNDRISSRQIDELIGLARGLLADGVLNGKEVEFLQTWLAANASISDQPLIRTLYDRVDAILADGVLSRDEHDDLFDALNALADRNVDLGEVLKSATLPLCKPPPEMDFAGRLYAFTGTFEFGQRKACEKAVVARGASTGGITRNTNFLVIGIYATESWKHSSMGNKIIKACELRDEGLPIAIVSEEHWRRYL